MRFARPSHIPTPAGITSLPVPTTPALPAGVLFPAGEAEALRRLQQFTQQVSNMDGLVGEPPIYDYALGRDRLSEDGTSMLSPYLRFGMLSARQAVVAALSALVTAPDEPGRRGAETWLNELAWREFYLQVLYHFPGVRQRNFRSSKVRWVNNLEHFEAWKAGRTGYPLVDAAMRQLVQSGWMHNRARMVVASFLTKDLLIDWRWGERWFMQHLVDGDPALNNGGWQWTAGTGTDAVPYFRILNPVTQSQKHDPLGVYIRRWLPELRAVPDEFIHQPWLMPPELQKACGVRIGSDYPDQLVEHVVAHDRALQAYRRT
jgi:deoxyribodipyrimidine photo-lyase